MVSKAQKILEVEIDSKALFKVTSKSDSALLLASLLWLRSDIITILLHLD
jgi:hypothetical protein